MSKLRRTSFECGNGYFAKAVSARPEANVVYASFPVGKFIQNYNPNRNGNIDPNRLLRVTDLGTN